MSNKSLARKEENNPNWVKYVLGTYVKGFLKKRGEEQASSNLGVHRRLCVVAQLTM